jgi:hypothetical protein
MQAIRSLISRFVSVVTATSIPVSVQHPTPLNEQDLDKVAGGLPAIGGLQLNSDGLPSAA